MVGNVISYFERKCIGKLKEKKHWKKYIKLEKRMENFFYVAKEHARQYPFMDRRILGNLFIKVNLGRNNIINSEEESSIFLRYHRRASDTDRLIWKADFSVFLKRKK